MNQAHTIQEAPVTSSDASLSTSRWLLPTGMAYVASVVLLWALVASLSLLSGVGGIPYVDAQYALPIAVLLFVYVGACSAQRYHRKRWWPIEFVIDKLPRFAIATVLALIPISITDRYIAYNVSEGVDLVLLEERAADTRAEHCPSRATRMEIYRRSDNTFTYRCVLWGKGGSIWPFYSGGSFALSEYSSGQVHP